MVLVVDDVAELRALMVRLLTMGGYEAHAVGSGEEALDFIKTKHPHCVILDIGLPLMDGFEVLKHIRADPAYLAIRVIMYSAFDGELKQRALRLGADHFVQKGSLDWARLNEVLGRFCKAGASGGRPEVPVQRRNKDACSLEIEANDFSRYEQQTGRHGLTHADQRGGVLGYGQRL